MRKQVKGKEEEEDEEEEREEEDRDKRRQANDLRLKYSTTKYSSDSCLFQQQWKILCVDGATSRMCRKRSGNERYRSTSVSQ